MDSNEYFDILFGFRFGWRIVEYLERFKARRMTKMPLSSNAIQCENVELCELNDETGEDERENELGTNRIEWEPWDDFKLVNRFETDANYSNQSDSEST